MPSYVRSGAPIRANSQTASSQTKSSITALADGGYVVTWQTMDNSADGYWWAIKSQRYNAQGVAVGAETLVNNLGAGDQIAAQTASLANGGYVVTWETSDSSQDGSGTAIKARLFDSTGTAVGGEFRVNSQATLDQKDPTVSGLSRRRLRRRLVHDRHIAGRRGLGDQGAALRRGRNRRRGRVPGQHHRFRKPVEDRHRRPDERRLRRHLADRQRCQFPGLRPAVRRRRGEGGRAVRRQRLDRLRHAGQGRRASRRRVRRHLDDLRFGQPRDPGADLQRVGREGGQRFRGQQHVGGDADGPRYREPGGRHLRDHLGR